MARTKRKTGEQPATGVVAAAAVAEVPAIPASYYDFTIHLFTIDLRVGSGRVRAAVCGVAPSGKVVDGVADHRHPAMCRGCADVVDASRRGFSPVRVVVGLVYPASPSTVAVP